MTINDDELITIDGLARMLGVSRATVNRYRSDGIGPRELKLGTKTVRFRRSDVEQWLEDEAA